MGNRRKVQRKLTHFTTTLSLSPPLVDAVLHSPVPSEAFMGAVGELHRKVQFVERLPAGTVALGNVTHDLNSLRLKVCVRVCVCEAWRERRKRGVEMLLMYTHTYVCLCVCLCRNT